MRIEVSIHAESGELFAPDAFKGNLGKSLPLRWGSGEVRATLVSALVSDEGRHALLTLALDPGPSLLDQLLSARSAWVPRSTTDPADLESPGRDRLLHGDWTDEVCP